MNTRHKTDAALEYILRDCLEAIQANPEGQKSEEYLATARACREELQRRQRLHDTRAIAQVYTALDPLRISRYRGGRRVDRFRLAVSVPVWKLADGRSAVWCLGWYRLHGQI